MKNKLKNIVLVLAVLLFFGQTSFCQDSELVRIYKEFPDSLFNLEQQGSFHVFSKDVREIVLTKGSFVKNSGKYIMNESDVGVPISSGQYPESIWYEIMVNENSGYINSEWFDGDLVLNIDFIVVRETGSYLVILLERYYPGYGNSVVFFISQYYFDPKSEKYVEEKIEFPDLNWNYFYSTEDLKVLDMSYLEYVDLLLNVEIVDDENQLSFVFTPNIYEMCYGFIGLMDFNYKNNQNFDDEYQFIYEKLGFDKLPDPKPVYYKVPEYVMVESLEK
jgi:hypothetical protein